MCIRGMTGSQRSLTETGGATRLHIDPGSCSGVALTVDQLQTGHIDVCVDLSCGDVSMTKHFLNLSQVGAAGKQMGCEAMSQGVWAD